MEGINVLSGVSFMESYKLSHEGQSYPHDLPKLNTHLEIRVSANNFGGKPYTSNTETILVWSPLKVCTVQVLLT